ncbi:MAG: hypothetical protein IGS38_17525 [Synechococcales cyanobacterium M58_A2018_015]|nr:hypothetical protein [Synechococcales cyanobacterium M58_A2018_015]
MASKNELQNNLKDKFGVNKNISEVLSHKECEELLHLLQREPSVLKLVASYAEKNNSLGRNNAHYGRARSQAERKFAAIQASYLELEKSIQAIKADKISLETKKVALEQKQKELEAEIQTLSLQNRSLASQVQTLTTHNDELTDANAQLKKENKDLKNIVDQIRLRLARDTKLLLQYEDSEIRKALIRLFKWTLG